MQRRQSLLAESYSLTFPQSFWAATDSVGTVTDSVPVHPEDRHHPTFEDLKQNKQRKPRSEQPPHEPDGKHPDPDHQIDEYA